jgi:hypothetical protein
MITPLEFVNSFLDKDFIPTKVQEDIFNNQGCEVVILPCRRVGATTAFIYLAIYNAVYNKENVNIFVPYYSWSVNLIKDIRRVLDKTNFKYLVNKQKASISLKDVKINIYSFQKVSSLRGTKLDGVVFIDDYNSDYLDLDKLEHLLSPNARTYIKFVGGYY